MMRVHKQAIAVGCVVLFSASSVGAEVLKNYKLGGQFDFQATAANNVTDFTTRGVGAASSNDRIGDAQTRIMLFNDWDLLDDVHARVTLRKNNRTYGTVGGNPQTANSETVTSTGASNGVLGSVAIDEASIKIDKIAGAVDLTLGRQFYTKGRNDLVIFFAPSEKARYGLPVDALDAARFDWENDALGLTGLVGKISGHYLGGQAQSGEQFGDTDLRGLHLTFKGNESWGGETYVYNRVVHSTGAAGAPPSNTSIGGKNDNLFVVGLRGKVAFGGLTVRGEFDKNFGENRQRGNATTASDASYTGWAAQGNVTYKTDMEPGALTAWAEGTVASGRSNSNMNKNDGFVPINGAYRPGSIYGRFSASTAFGFSGLGSGLPAVNGVSTPSDSANLSNRVIWGSGVRFSPAFASKLTVAASYWDFKLQRLTQWHGQTRPFSNHKHIGSEGDLDFFWAHSENVTLAAGVAKFFPGALIYESIRQGGAAGRGVNAATLSYFDVRVRF